jgi:pimeloyl-ACP methyl ester carboxylesterase
MNTPSASILDLPAISGCYLFPQPRTIKDPFVVTIDDVQLACHRHVVDPQLKTVLHFHGNGEAVADYVPELTNQFTNLGLNCLLVEYREYGDSTGNAQLVAMLGDGEAVMRAAGLTPETVIAFGRSIGSLYAIELAHRQPDIAGLILESGIADPAERFLTYADLAGAGLQEELVRAEVKRHFNHQQKLSAYSRPLLVLHAENDSLIEVSHATRNYQWAASSQKRVVRFPIGDHNSIMAWNQQEYFRAVAEFVESLDTC